jgi:hypothetical protein
MALVARIAWLGRYLGQAFGKEGKIVARGIHLRGGHSRGVKCLAVNCIVASDFVGHQQVAGATGLQQTLDGCKLPEYETGREFLL